MWKCASGSMNSKHMLNTERRYMFEDISTEGSYLTSLSNTVRYPITCVGYPMIYSRLSLLSTTVSSRHKSYQSPSSFMFHHQRSTTVTLAGIFASVVISSAYHFVIDDNVYTLVSVPLLALSVVYHWNINYLDYNSIVCNQFDCL